MYELGSYRYGRIFAHLSWCDRFSALARACLDRTGVSDTNYWLRGDVPLLFYSGVALNHFSSIIFWAVFVGCCLLADTQARAARRTRFSSLAHV